MDYLYIAAGLVLLFAGGEGLVRGSVTLAERMGLSKLLIGMVIVGFGTSTPELLVSVQAALEGSPEIAIGNIVGSNIANILLILALGALIFPLPSGGFAVKRDALVMVGATLLLWLMAMQNTLTPLMGGCMVAILVAYVVYAYISERRNHTDTDDVYVHETEEKESPPLSMPFALMAVAAGLAMLVFGADFLVKGSTSIAKSYGVPESIIGLTIVAVGTSLPELAATIVAALRKHGDVILGNIIGSNIFNILMILGVTSLISPVPVAHTFTVQDIPLALITAIVLTALIWGLGSISRTAGTLFLVAYTGYVGWLITTM